MKIQDRALLVSIGFSSFGMTKEDRQVTREVILQHKAASDAGKFRKLLLPKESLSAITTIISQARAYFYEETLLWDDKGWRILPSEKYMAFAEKLRGFKAEFEVEVDKFLTAYAGLVEKRRVELNGLFKASDYPKEERLRRQFAFQVKTAPIPDGSDFRVDLGEDVREGLAKQTSERVEAALKDAEVDLWRRLAEPVQKMVSVLGDVNKQVRDSLVENLRAICGTVKGLNLMKNPDLERMRQEVMLQLATIEPDGVRVNDSARSEAARKAAEIMAKMRAFLPEGEDEA